MGPCVSVANKIQPEVMHAVHERPVLLLMNEESDIDVVVELGKPDLFYLIGIKQDLEEKFRRPVDIVRYRDTMNGFLKKRIDKEAVYV